MPPPGLCRDGWHWPAPRGRSLAIAEPFTALMAWVALTNIGKCGAVVFHVKHYTTLHYDTLQRATLRYK